jgi:phosphinothricin acetyltransferase
LDQSFTIRRAHNADLASIVAILNPYIMNTTITFDTEPYTAETRQPWFNMFSEQGRHQCLVAEYDQKIIGYANSGIFKPKRAYDTSVEVSVYRAPDVNIRGVGKALYNALFSSLNDTDIHRAYAYITLPNEASIALHRKFGFTEAGLLSDAGRKFGQYHSVMLMEKVL